MSNPKFTLEYLHEAITKLGLPIAGISPENNKIHSISIGYATFFERSDNKFFRVDWVDEPLVSQIESAREYLNSTIGLTEARPVTKVGQRQYSLEEIARIESLASAARSVLNSDFIVGPHSSIAINSNSDETITSISQDDAFLRLFELIQDLVIDKKRDLSRARFWYFFITAILIIIMIIGIFLVFVSFFKLELFRENLPTIINPIVSAILSIASFIGIKNVYPSLEKRFLFLEKDY
ncbi:MAG: hypothetical protein JEZ00_22110, partial [Anaerolineaceae bacterium]|nr:hypothetical protein [Anaerolineaceae bacterium]